MNEPNKADAVKAILAEDAIRRIRERGDQVTLKNFTREMVRQITRYYGPAARVMGMKSICDPEVQKVFESLEPTWEEWKEDILQERAEYERAVQDKSVEKRPLGSRIKIV